MDCLSAAELRGRFSRTRSPTQRQRRKQHRKTNWRAPPARAAKKKTPPALIQALDASNSRSLAFCRPSAAKFPGASQRSSARLRRGHSLSSIAYQAVWRLRPLTSLSNSLEGKAQAQRRATQGGMAAIELLKAAKATGERDRLRITRGTLLHGVSGRLFGRLSRCQGLARCLAQARPRWLKPKKCALGLPQDTSGSSSTLILQPLLRRAQAKRRPCYPSASMHPGASAPAN